MAVTNMTAGGRAGGLPWMPGFLFSGNAHPSWPARWCRRWVEIVAQRGSPVSKLFADELQEPADLLLFGKLEPESEYLGDRVFG